MCVCVGVLLLLWGVSLSQSQQCGDSCSGGMESEPLPVEADNADSANVNIFDDLNQAEMQAVIDYLAQQDDINLKQFEMATPNSTYIFLIEALPPVKAEALAFLDHGGPRPDRYAKVVLYRGDREPQVVEELKVGPLPNPNTHSLLLHPTWARPTIPYYMRSFFSDVEGPLWEEFIRQQVARVDHILAEVTGYKYNDCDNRCLYWFPSNPGSFKNGTRKMWINLLRQVEGYYLHPIGLQLRINAARDSPADWYVDSVWFRGQSYTTLDNMVSDYPGHKAALMAKPALVYDTEDPALYSSLKTRGEPLPSKPMRGPQQVLPDGRRWQVKGHHVKWQGWSFDLNMRSQLGLQVHDVRFRGERVAYELTLSEIAVLYSGASPLPLHTAYVDSLFQFGREMYAVVPGGDCPLFASYFDFVHYLGFKPLIYKNSACVFEWDRGTPLRRHYDSDHQGSYYFYQSMPDNVLIVRSMITAFNYEYMLDYVFHQNGVIELKCSLSGYVLATFYTGSDEDMYGYEIFPQGIGNIHNHLVHFKLDLDIAGEKNRFQTLDVTTKNVPDVTENSSPDVRARMLQRVLRKTETQATSSFDVTSPRYLLIINQNKTNDFNNPRGYRIIPGQQSRVLLDPGQDVEGAYTWARHQVAVTKRKDEEDAASSVYASLDQFQPVFKFQQFIDDDENIVDEDLVAWVTAGVVHIPHSEDVPIVQTPGVQLTVLLQPFNFFNQDPSLASRDNVRTTPGQHGGHVYQWAHGGGGAARPALGVLGLLGVAVLTLTAPAVNRLG